MDWSDASPSHIGLIVEQRYLTQAQPAGLAAALNARGHRITLIVPEKSTYQIGDHNWLDGLDLIVARGRSWALLCLLAWAEACGKRTLNRRTAIAAVRSKAEMAVALAGAGLPIARTFLSPVERLASHLGDDAYPLILKPNFGDNSQGLRVIDAPTAVAGLAWPEPVALAQAYLPGDGYDLKLYAIGDDVWAVRKQSSLSQPSPAPAQPLSITPPMRELAQRCGRLFGLELFGVDCLKTPAGLVVIEVNDFPNYSGVPDADNALADYVARCTRQEKHA